MTYSVSLIGAAELCKLSVSVHLSFVCPDYHELIHNFLLLIASERQAEGKTAAGSMHLDCFIFSLRCQNKAGHANELLENVPKKMSRASSN